ncbi:MAG TPA: hypothetical protein VI750_00315 [Pyrinomonadaceae bacterium]|nr:hypothetical protein [Pyrinomonadaceae bacterium]HLE61541.1 hypothetical protein [Pyrinomonadaceae bacterium]
MSRINWNRVVIGAVIAATIAFITDGLLHERLLAVTLHKDNYGSKLTTQN